MKKALFFLVLVCIVTAVSSQIKAPDHLLWYKGKLLKPNVLLTTTGDTVLYSQQKRQVKVVSKSGTGKQFDKMYAELSNTAKRIDATVRVITKTVPRHVRVDFSNAVTVAFMDVEDKWKPLLGNTITLPEGEPVFGVPAKSVSGKGGPGNFIDYGNSMEDSKYEEILKKFRAFIEKHKNDDLGILPVPPRYNFSYCYPCDNVAQERYDKEVKRFIAEVTGLDSDIINEALQFSAYLQKSTVMGSYEEEANNEAWSLIHFILNRGAKRAALLLDKYRDDATRLPAILDYVLPVHRQLQLMGENSNPTALTNLDYFGMIYTTLHKFFSNAMKEKDYSIGLNIHFILKMERERQILGHYISGKENLLEQYLTFNQFKLNSNITAKLGGDGGYIAGHVRGDNWFYAIPNQETCRLNWILASDKTDRTADYKLLSAELVGAPVYYVGTKDWQSQPPSIKMDFCYPEGKEVPDSILAATFHPEGFREQWKFPDPEGVKEVEQVSGILMACFLDMKRAKKEADQVSKGMFDKKKQELQAKYAKLATGNISAQANMAHDMQADLEKFEREIKEMIARTNPLTYIFTPQVNNKTTEILKERLDGREIFPENGAIQYAWFHLTMEHDPQGPHRIPSMLSLLSIR
jgi:hypothetical protein